MKKMLLGFFIIISFIISCLAGSAFAAMDLKDSSWILYGKGAINAGKFGRQMIAGYLFVDFASSGYVTFTDEQGYYLTGSYGFDSTNNLFINMSASMIENFISDNLGIASGYADIYVTRVLTKATLKDTNLSFSLKFTALVDAYGYDEEIKISCTISANGVFNSREGSSWQLDNAKVNFNLGKSKHANLATLLLQLGPNDEEGLDRNQFAIYEANGSNWDYIIGGRFARSKNKVTFIIDFDNFSDLLDKYAKNAISGSDFYNAYVWDHTTKVTATVKDGVGITFKSMSKFRCDLSNDYDSVKQKGSYTVSGKGIPKKGG